MSIDLRKYWDQSDRDIYNAMVGADTGSIYWDHLNALVKIRSAQWNRRLSLVIAIATVVMALTAMGQFWRPVQINVPPPAVQIIQPQVPTQSTEKPKEEKDGQTSKKENVRQPNFRRRK